ncbi:hypothetical protein MSBRW_1651 [Methanosarcina barkeri str. Wiesmoor]|uniref:Uncharacterized protein n=2 Tax=Methanosarcina barkeri TaxID=2208 RepID=A0A0E3QMF4_METBA|nr:hypothetical protein [Methanosarcina barkeri]AKB50904.1 hypothetical protein MSBRW_1651 [Methanosarcina barkeri str. Wiesmoor]
MTQESGNKLNIQDEELSYTVNQHSSQNIVDKRSSQNVDNKYIDTDPISYITDLIIQISKNITKGHGLSKKGVNSLFLFLLTGSLLYQYTQFPQTLIQFFKIYAVPLIFLFYSFIDILKNVPFVNTLYVAIFKESDFICTAITNNAVSLDDLERYLLSMFFTPQQFIDIIEYLIKNNQFSPKCQVNLVKNVSLYEIESINYIKDLMLNFNFTSQAICIFLSKMQTRLDFNYLDKLTEKYREFPTVLFLAGSLHLYKINEPNSLYKYGHECENNPPHFNYSRNEMFLFGIVISLVAVLIYIMYKYSSTSAPMIVNLSGDVSGNVSGPLSGLASGPLSVNMSISHNTFVILLSILVIYMLFTTLKSLYDMHSVQSIQKYLMDKDLDEDVVEYIVEELDSINYFHRSE